MLPLDEPLPLGVCSGVVESCLVNPPSLEPLPVPGLPPPVAPPLELPEPPLPELLEPPVPELLEPLLPDVPDLLPPPLLLEPPVPELLEPLLPDVPEPPLLLLPPPPALAEIKKPSLWVGWERSEGCGFNAARAGKLSSTLALASPTTPLIFVIKFLCLPEFIEFSLQFDIQLSNALLAVHPVNLKFVDLF
jgi:hypothetical protein